MTFSLVEVSGSECVDHSKKKKGRAKMDSSKSKI